MSKKVTAGLFAIVILIVAMDIGVVFPMWKLYKTKDVDQKVNTTATDNIKELEEEIESLQEKNNALVTRNKRLRKSLKEQIKETSEIKDALTKAYADMDALNSLLDELFPDEELTTETVATPVPTVSEPPAPGAAINGTYTEPGFGRVEIIVEAVDDSNYVITINGSNGASSNSTSNLTGTWDAASSSVVYTGSRTDNENGVVTSYYNESGRLYFTNGYTLYWTDASSNNVDRGPFVKQ